MNAERLMPFVLAGIALLEMVASALWWAPYFRGGLRLFREELSAIVPVWHLPTIASLEERFARGLGPSLSFRALDSGEIAFRERAFELRLFSYAPVMHGLIRINPETRSVVVEGRANWFPLLFASGIFTFVWRRPGSWQVAPFLVAFLALIYWVQRRLYRRVGRCVAGEDAASAPVTSTAGNKIAWILLAALIAVAALVVFLDHS